MEEAAGKVPEETETIVTQLQFGQHVDEPALVYANGGTSQQ